MVIGTILNKAEKKQWRESISGICKHSSIAILKGGLVINIELGDKSDREFGVTHTIYDNILIEGELLIIDRDVLKSLEKLKYVDFDVMSRDSEGNVYIGIEGATMTQIGKIDSMDIIIPIEDQLKNVLETLKNEYISFTDDEDECIKKNKLITTLYTEYTRVRISKQLLYGSVLKGSNLGCSISKAGDEVFKLSLVCENDFVTNYKVVYCVLLE